MTAVWGAYGALNSASASQALYLGPQRAEKCDVPGIFVTGPILPTSLSGGTVTEVRLRAGLPSHPHELPHVPGVSWRPQPARAATRRPGRTSDGRNDPEQEELKLAPPRVLELEVRDLPVRVRYREEVADAGGVDPLAVLEVAVVGDRPLE